MAALAFSVSHTPLSSLHPVVLSDLIQAAGQPFASRYLDRTANALLTGAKPEDGGRVGLAFKSTANGSCFFNSAATGAWGGGQDKPSSTDVLALPLRIAVIIAGVKRLVEIGQETSDYFRTMEAYDSDVLDLARARDVDALLPGRLAEDVSRALLVLALSTILGEFTDGSIFCMPLLAEALGVNVRCYLPGKRSS